MKALWLILGILALALGTVGLFLPLLPTVPFLLLAAFCFARSSRRLHHWLLNHRHFGPPLEAWQQHGAIGRPAKLYATVSFLMSLGITLLLGFGPTILALQAVTLGLVALFIWTRPEA